MDCVEFYFKKIYADEAELELDKIKRVLNTFVVEYQRKGQGINNQDWLLNSNGKRATQASCEDEEDEYAQAKKTKMRKVNVRCEVDHYLEEDPLSDDDGFDILYWWRNDIRYPTLQKIAKDILAIPVSIVASESAFSMGGRVVSPHRSRLNLTTVEALMCLQNWMIEDVKGNSFLYIFIFFV